MEILTNNINIHVCIYINFNIEKKSKMLIGILIKKYGFSVFIVFLSNVD